MTSTILPLLCLILIALWLRSELALENLALRQQLAVLNRQHRRPKLRRSDRVFWLFLSRFGVHWTEALNIVKPDTVVPVEAPGVRTFCTMPSNDCSVLLNEPKVSNVRMSARAVPSGAASIAAAAATCRIRCFIMRLRVVCVALR